ncbi:MAG: DUF6655 family protein [Thermoguttaceae bacterium]
MRLRFLTNYSIFISLLVVCGCGTTKWTDTSRTATEQLLISHAIDHTIEQFDFSPLSGKKVYIDPESVSATTDSKYLCAAIKEHIASYGAKLCEKKEEAEFVAELRAGAVGTDRNDLLYGVPAFTVPTFGIGSSGISGASFPEIAFAKKTNQRAVCKIAVFVYHRDTGQPLWCSGNRLSEGNAKSTWVLGAGPFNKGSIYKGTEFQGSQLPTLVGGTDEETPQPLASERYFLPPTNDNKENGDSEESGENSGESSAAKTEVNNTGAPRVPLTAPPTVTPAFTPASPQTFTGPPTGGQMLQPPVQNVAPPVQYVVPPVEANIPQFQPPIPVLPPSKTVSSYGGI